MSTSEQRRKHHGNGRAQGKLRGKIWRKRERRREAEAINQSEERGAWGGACVAMVTYSVASWVMLLKVNAANVLMLLLLRSLYEHMHTQTHNINTYISILAVPWFITCEHCVMETRAVHTPETGASGPPAPWGQSSACCPPGNCQERCVVIQ